MQNDEPKPRLLVVDDEPIALKTTRYIMGRSFEVTCAGCVSEGLEKVANSGPFDVALVDDRMPDGRGLVVLLALKDRWPGCLRYLVSANLGIEDELGADFFREITFEAKPLDFSRFLPQLSTALAARPIQGSTGGPPAAK